MTPQELANLAHLRRARDLIDREYARRIERAMALLRGGMSVTDACMTVGCTSLGSFSSRFTEIVGETPSAYRSREHPAVTAMPPCVAKVRTRPTRNSVSRNGEAARGAAA